MARTPRTQFAAPLVICLGAAACGGEPAAPPRPVPPVVVAAPTPPPDAAPTVAFRGRQWAIQRRPDGSCALFHDTCRGDGVPIAACNPPRPRPMPCPVDAIAAITETAPGVCEAAYRVDCDPGVKCNPPPPRPIACPP